MPAKKRTRSQKIKAENRHYLYHREELEDLKTLDKKEIKKIKEISTTVAISASNPFPEVIKTTFLVSFFVVSELFIFFLIKKHFIYIPGLNY